MANNYSVVIRTRNEERFIGYAIQSIVDYIGENLELIIIDNHSTDETLKIVNLFEYLSPKVIKVDGPTYTPGLTLNTGVNNASHDTIVFLSAHCQITSWSDDTVNDKFLDKKVAAIFGKQNPIYLGKKITPRYLWSHFDNTERKNYYSKLEGRYFLHNAFAIYKKSILEKFPFDEKLSGKEDRYWANNIVKNGLDFVYDPRICCQHHYTPDGNTWKGIG
jgi:glycosyltransferase involved in cell wall biosynthesis